MIPQMLAIWSLFPLPFLNPVFMYGSSRFMYCWSLTWRILSITFLACEIMQFCGSLKVLWHCPSLELEWKLFFSVLWPLLNFQICWHVERSSLTASSFRIWNNSAVIPSPPLALSVVMLPKAHLTLHCTFPNTAQEAVIKTIPKKKKCKMVKWLSEEALQIALKRREVKSKGEKEIYTLLNAEFQRTARRNKKDLRD